ncbi:MAG: hypothetical protein ABR910_12655 [Acidobacteriaceae bacterium]|jgi:hypothetical protein
MRSTFLLAAILAAIQATCPASQAVAQNAPTAPPPPAGSNWQHVQALPINTDIHVQARTRRSLCTLKAVDADTLTCERNTGVGVKQLTFWRSEIRTIKLARRGRSGVFGGLIGAGAGALAGGIGGLHSHYFAVPGAWATIFAFAGAFAGAPTGYLTDFTTCTVYTARH